MPIRYFRNILIFIFIFVILGEFLSRKRYAEPFQNPAEEVVAIQKLLVLDDQLGFHWKENVHASEEIRFADQDSESWPLSTDMNGFINPPQVLKKRANGDAVHVVGLGDSFIEHAAYYISDFFSERGLNYCNLAIHRQSPPQYLDILRTYANPLKPGVVLLGITENDLDEIEDYLTWRESGLDWFTFHSGTWYGRPLQSTPLLRARDNVFPGYTSLFSLMESRAPALGKLRKSSADHTDANIESWLERIQDETNKQEQRLIVLLIPTKESVLIQRTEEHVAFESVLRFCEESDITFLDLHPVFREHENPPSLYYAINGHWNGNGINVALEKVVELHPEILSTSKDQ